MNRSQKADNRLTFVFTYMLKSFAETEWRIREEIRKLGLASVNDVSAANQSLMKTIQNDLADLTSKEDQPGHDYFEDHFNLALSNLSQNILPLTNIDMNNTSNVLTSNNNLINCADPHQSSQHQQQQQQSLQFSFKLPDYDKENPKDDVMLKFIQHLENNTASLIKQIQGILEQNNNPDLKMLRERNVELTTRLKDELKLRDQAVQKLIETEANALKYFNHIQTCEDELKNLDALRDQNEKLKRQLKQYEIDYRRLIRDKEDLDKYNLLFKDNLPDLEKKLKHDLEQSRKKIEIIEKERDDVEYEFNELRSKKEKQEDENRRLIKELELQKQNFENDIKAAQKHLDNQKKFIEAQTQERENEFDEYLCTLNELKAKLKEKETKESDYLNRIQQYEEQIEQFNQEKQQLDKCYEETIGRLTTETKKNKQLQALLEEYEKTKEKTEQVEKELRERLSKLEEDLYSQLRLNETLKKNQTEQSLAIVSSFVDNVCENVEQLRCSSMNHESNMLKAISFLDQNSNNHIQETLNFSDKQQQLHQSDSVYNSSTGIDCSFPDAKKLEEKNSKLNSLVADVVQENNVLNDQLKTVKLLNQKQDNLIRSLEHDVELLKSSIEKMSLEKRVLESSINEKETRLNELQSQLEEKSNDVSNESMLKQSIESLKRKLQDEEQKVFALNEELKKTNTKLTDKQTQVYKISNQIDRLKSEKRMIEEERVVLKQRNQELHDERFRLQQEIEDLQNDYEDEMEDNADLKKMFETFLLDKDEEIATLNCFLDEINRKLRDCFNLASSPDNRESKCFTLLDKLILSYQKNRINPSSATNNPLSVPSSNKRNRNTRKKQISNESLDSLSPIESCEDAFTSDELNDDDICNKLAGIHNNSVEICNLSFHFKNEKDLFKLINEIPTIVTDSKLTKREINEWQIGFIECFSNKEIARSLTKNIISLRPTYMANNSSDRFIELEKQLKLCEANLAETNSELRKSNEAKKALIFQKRYLTNSNRQAIRQLSTKKTNHHQYRSQSRGIRNFRKLVFGIIAFNRLRKIRQHDQIQNNAQNRDLMKIIDQLNEKLTDVLNPTAEKYSSFIDSLRPAMPLAVRSHLLPYHDHRDAHQPREETIKTLADLKDSLKAVYERLDAYNQTLLTTDSSCSWLSN